MTKLQLTLAAFRCYDDEITFNFTASEITRIRGHSGIGKSTLFDAIQWLLYNYPISNIYPRHGKNKNTYVRLVLPWGDKQVLTLERRKNPGLLILTYPNGLHEEDDVAQGSIERLFGCRDIWLTCSYLRQDEYCPLLSFSNVQRMDILESLAFLNETPDADLEKIQAEVERLQAIFNSNQDKVKDLDKLLTSITPEGNLDEILLDEKGRQDTLKDLEDLRLEIRDLKDKVIIAEERKKQHTLLEGRLKKTQASLAKLPYVDPDEINRLEVEMSTLQEDLPRFQQIASRLDLEKKRETYQRDLPNILPENEYSQDDYREAFTLEKEIADEQKIARTWKLNYQPEVIAERIASIKSLLEAQREIKIWSEVTALENKIKSLSGPDVDLKDLQKAQDELKASERSLDVHKCPSCKRSLRYLRNTLVLSEISPISQEKVKKSKEALVLLEESYRKTTERRIAEMQRTSLQNTLQGQKSPPGHVLKSEEIKRLEREMTELGRLIFPARPKASSQEIQANHNYWRLKTKIMALEEEIAKYPSGELRSSPQEIIKNLNNNRQRLQHLHEIQTQREILIKQSQTYFDDLQKIPLIIIESYRDKICINETLEKHLLSILALDEQAQEYLRREEEYNRAYDKMLTSNVELAAALRLKDLANREVCEILEEKITTINLVIAEICGKIFRDPINVELAMLKTTKTTKVTKPCVHLKIWYRDAEYDNISQMSGGEKRRVSLAVSLALSQLNSFPLLLLDECLNGLDEELKETTLDVIRDVAHKKSVWVICHDSGDGAYDHVVNLDGTR